MRPSRQISRHWHRRWLYAYCPPYRWWKSSALYHRCMAWRLKRAMRRLSELLAVKLPLACESASAGMRALQKACEDAGLGDW
jgi:hypothetical protein